MNGFRMDTDRLEEASGEMGRLSDGMSELGLDKCEESFDCGDSAMRDALMYFVSMHNRRGQATREWLNKTASGLHATAHATQETDDEVAAVFEAIRAKL